MLHKGRREFIDSIAAYTDHGVHWEGITDHRPLWTTYIVPSALEKVPQKEHREQIRWELPLTDRRLRDAFIEGMEAIHTRFPPPGENAGTEECLRYVAGTERRSGALVKKLHVRFGIGKARSTYKDGWSPRYIAHKTQLGTLVEIRRHLTGARHRSRWKDAEETETGMMTLLDSWEAVLQELDLTQDVKDGLTSLEFHGLDWWRALAEVPTVTLVDEEIAALKKLMHGKARSEADCRWAKLRSSESRCGKMASCDRL